MSSICSTGCNRGFPRSAQGPIPPARGSYSERRRAAFVITSSEETREQVTLFYGVPADRIRVIPFPTPQSARGSLHAAKDEQADLRSKHGIRGHICFIRRSSGRIRITSTCCGLKALRDSTGSISPWSSPARSRQRRFRQGRGAGARDCREGPLRRFRFLRRGGPRSTAMPSR